MKCPKCQNETKHNKTYNMDLCVNPNCSYYMKDDIKNLSQPVRSKHQGNLSVDKKVRDVINNFDFDKVKKVMDYLNWDWRGQIPTINEIIGEAQRLLYDAVQALDTNNSDEAHVGTGGFNASAYKDSTTGEIDVHLDFRLDEFNSFY